MRNLLVVLGDQLDHESAVFDGFDPTIDRVWMAEVEAEAIDIRQHQQRLVLFFSAMRHFRDRLRSRGVPVVYQALSMDPATDRGRDFAAVLREDVPRFAPERLIVVEPGDYRVREQLQGVAGELGVTLEIRADRHFLCDTEAFRTWASGRRTLVMEHFYRAMRRRHGVLMDGDEPEGGRWNFDHDNRESFGSDGPGETPRLPVFAPDDTTRAVIEIVAARFPDHHGRAADFDQPVTPADARHALRDFIAHRLAGFGRWQDAMWTGAHFLYHSRLSASLNLHLLDPRECIDAAVDAYRDGRVPMNAVEGFVRQILGWREFVRGIYWLRMPDYARRNALGHEADLPPAYWHGRTDMACVADAMSNVLEHGYAHHIQRLMVLGLFAQLVGVHPYRFHQWHMAMYLDAVDWVSLPNTLGMSQFGDGGEVGTKPYCASGAYIQRMSNHCGNCRYDPKRTEGERACPVTVMYWDFLARHEAAFRGNRRMAFQLRNLARRRENGQLDRDLETARRLRAALARGEGL